MTRRIIGTASLAVLALTLGCAGISVKTYAKPAIGQRQYGKVKKVAILPFDSLAEGAAVPKAAGDVFLQEVLSRGTFDAVEEPRYVAALMKKLKLRNTEELDREVVRKIGDELKAEALVLGNVILFGQQKDSEVTEFSMRANLLDVETGDLLWSGETYVSSSTSAGEVLGVNKGPSPNELSIEGVKILVSRLDRDFRRAREAEVERMLEAAKAEKAGAEAAPGVEAGAPSAQPGAAPAPPKEQEGEEILLQVKPK
jgi:PBP1b-binding outer membrane lipoprotein LpoB